MSNRHRHCCRILSEKHFSARRSSQELAQGEAAGLYTIEQSSSALVACKLLILNGECPKSECPIWLRQTAPPPKLLLSMNLREPASAPSVHARRGRGNSS